METHFACYSQALAEAGIPIDKAQFFSQAGMTGREQISLVCPEGGRQRGRRTPSTGARGRSSGSASRRQRRSTAWSSCCTCCARQGHRIAIATGSSRPSVQPVIDQFDLAPDALVTSEDVQRGKPHPDLFLLARRAPGRRRRSMRGGGGLRRRHRVRASGRGCAPCGFSILLTGICNNATLCDR